MSAPVSLGSPDGLETPRPAGTGLGAKAQSAVLWNTGFNLFRDLLQFAVMLVLVRLLPPSAYGEFSLVTSMIGFISIFSFNNFLAYTLQVRREEETHYQDQFTAGSVIQTTLFLLTNAIAVMIRWIPSYAAVSPLVHVMSLTFLISLPCDFRIKMLERQLDWRRLRLLHALGLVLVAIAAIALALVGAGAYALLVPGMLVTIPFVADLVLKLRWKPQWTWSWERYKRAWVFGLSRIGSGAATAGRQLLESGVLASVVGFATLGFVNRALGLAQLFCIKFSAQLLYALYPLLARSEPGTGAFQKVSGLVLRCIAWVALPVAILLSLLAPVVVRTIYGDPWAPVIDLLPFAMAFGFAAALAHATYMLLLANNRAGWCLALDAAACVGTVVNVFLVLPLGLLYYLGASVCLQAALCCVEMALLLRIGSVNWSGLGRACLPPIAASAFAFFTCEAVLRVLGADRTVFFVAVSYGVAFSLGYALLLRICFSGALKELIDYLPASHRINRLLAYT
jgi:PST family polysaccharide transporter